VTRPVTDTDIRYYGSFVYSVYSVMHNNRSVGDHVTAMRSVVVFRAWRQSLNNVLNDRNVTNSDHRLLCVTASISPFNDPCKNRSTPDHSNASLGCTGVETRISVNAARIASLPTTCMWTTNDDLCLCWRCRTVAVIGGS